MSFRQTRNRPQNGGPRPMLHSIAESGSSVCAGLTSSTHPADRRTGQLASRHFYCGYHGRDCSTPMLRYARPNSPARGFVERTADRQQVIVVLDGKGFETSMISVPKTGRLAMSMPALSPRSRQPTDKLRKRTIHFKPGDQRPVAPHHTRGQQPDSRASNCLLMCVLKRHKIIRGQKTEFAREHDSERGKSNYLPQFALVAPCRNFAVLPTHR